MPPQCRLSARSPLCGAVTILTSHDCVHRPRQSRRSVSQLFHGPTRPAFTLHPSTGSQTTCGDRIRYSGSNVWRTATRRALAALPILSALVLVRSPPTARPGAALHRTRGNARGGGPWQPWANCRGRPALRPCRLCPAARVGLTSTPGSHTHCAIRKTRGSYMEKVKQASYLVETHKYLNKGNRILLPACLLGESRFGEGEC